MGSSMHGGDGAGWGDGSGWGVDVREGNGWHKNET